MEGAVPVLTLTPEEQMLCQELRPLLFILMGTGEMRVLRTKCRASERLLLCSPGGTRPAGPADEIWKMEKGVKSQGWGEVLEMDSGPMESICWPGLADESNMQERGIKECTPISGLCFIFSVPLRQGFPM